MVKYLQSLGLWPRTPTSTEVDAAGGGRAEIAFRHFTSRAVQRHFNWSPAQVVSALSLYAEEQAFTPAESAVLAELTAVYLRIAEEEAP